MVRLPSLIGPASLPLGTRLGVGGRIPTHPESSTPWWDQKPADQTTSLFAEYAEQTPVGWVGQPEDVAQAILSLLGNGFLTGIILTVDGGLSLAYSAARALS